jgi:imidazole glycerol-phosphate synthase subunit HisH
MDIAVVDFGMGNTGSVQNMLNHLGIRSVVSGDRAILKDAPRLILPGVGAFDAAMNRLKEMDLLELIHTKAMILQTPVLGICLGMQLLAENSEEGDAEGFGWVAASVKKFRFEDQVHVKVPHVGWNRVSHTSQHPLVRGIGEEDRFYFVHSYYVDCRNANVPVSKTQYGISFDSVIASDNIMGCQFHPEKSHKSGMKIFQNFNKL